MHYRVNLHVVTQATRHPLIEEAIRLAGSQAKLAKAINSSQSAVSRMLLREVPVSLEAAMLIERAVGIPARAFRPEFFEPPPSPSPGPREGANAAEPVGAGA